VIVLVVGGARSGKSNVAEQLAGRMATSVTYVATLDGAGDPDLAARIELHRLRRPASWQTIEARVDLPELLAELPGTVLLDSLGPWVAGAPGMKVDDAGLCAALVARDGDTVVVSEEVGLGVHPSSTAGRQFRDALGQLNQAVAAVADEVQLVVAGRVLRLGPGEVG
jgi:adenosyl cobinamide kinase/adenosyl cobinamide phosphate guanylyltransferase